MPGVKEAAKQNAPFRTRAGVAKAKTPAVAIVYPNFVQGQSGNMP